METKINIAEILKDKPKGIRLYSPIFGECAFSFVQEETDDICVKKHNGEKVFFNSKGLYNILGECLLFPSRNMRDWSKFLWKKGDILVSNDSDSHIIFEGFSKDDYTTFEGKHWISVSEKRHISYLNMQNTQSYHIEDKDAAQTYINAIEERFGGKLNLETLEIEKQPEFKDGDILYGEKDELHTDAIFILKIVKEKRNYYACLVLNPYMTCDYIGIGFAGNKTLRYATEQEKQQLFDALEKKGKVWDDEKKQIVDLKPKWTPKPFDRVITRGDNNAIWTANIFSHIDRHGQYVTIGCIGGYPYCIPYNEKTAKLIGTKNNLEG